MVTGLESLLEWHVKQRARRADLHVTITPELLGHWVHEEMQLLLAHLDAAAICADRAKRLAARLNVQ